MSEVTTCAVEDVLDRIRGIAESTITEHSVAVDREGRFPEENLGALGDVDALGLLVDREHGGLAGGLSDLAVACETIGAACASTAMVFLMHAVTTASISRGGGPPADSLLPRLAGGDALGTLAFSERGTGAHFYAPELQASRSNGSVRVTGRKSFVTSAGHADVMLVLLQSDAEGLDCYAVSRTSSGVTFDGTWDGLGMRGNSSIAASFQDVIVSDDARIGAPGTAGDLVFGVVAPVFLAGLAAVNIGIAQSAVTDALEHAKKRSYPDGQTLSEIPTIQHALADMDIRTRAARALVRSAAALADADDPGALVPLMEAKISATDTAAAVTQSALEVCGGQGYTTALPAERHLRDARAGAVMAPTNGVLRTWTGKALAGLPVP
jgi:isovaleryl-CoA dehydrogenase